MVFSHLGGLDRGTYLGPLPLPWTTLNPYHVGVNPVVLRRPEARPLPQCQRDGRSPRGHDGVCTTAQ
jgi:hypothetical protein